MQILGSNTDTLDELVYPHLIIAAPQFSPAPNPDIAIISPFFTFPDCTASAKASGMEPVQCYEKFQSIINIQQNNIKSDG